MKLFSIILFSSFMFVIYLNKIITIVNGITWSSFWNVLYNSRTHTVGFKFNMMVGTNLLEVLETSNITVVNNACRKST